MNDEERAVAKAAVNKFRMERARKGLTEASHQKRSQSLKGHFVSEETKEKIRQKALGRKHSAETKEKIRQYFLGKKNPKAKNEHSFKPGTQHPNWKGDEVGYRDLHLWVERQLGKPDTCEHCGKKSLTGRQIHWANKSGEYRRDVNDWIRLCAPCHGKYDKDKITS